MGVDRTAEAAMIDAPPAMIDWDATAATDTTTNRNAENAAVVEAIAGGDTEATIVEQHQKKGHGQKTTIDATTAIDATTVSVAKKWKRIMSIVAT
jgi:hypothetical protein